MRSTISCDHFSFKGTRTHFPKWRDKPERGPDVSKTLEMGSKMSMHWKDPPMSSAQARIIPFFLYDTILLMASRMGLIPIAKIDPAAGQPWVMPESMRKRKDEVAEEEEDAENA